MTEPNHATPPRPHAAASDSPISLEESTLAPGETSGKIKITGALANAAGLQKTRTWVRPTNTKGTGAVRVRSFHGRLSVEGLAFMDDKINEWLDQHPEVEVKFVTSCIGVFEGKVREPALILNVWY